MQYFDILLIALALSFDTFAVSVSTGLIIREIKFWQATKIALILAIFQALAPVIGWYGGLQIEKYIAEYDHWISLILLSILGIKMIMEARKEDEKKEFNPLKLSVCIGMAVATSIDALIVGITFAFMKIHILIIIFIIGFITYLSSMLGILLGKQVNSKNGQHIETLGGIILILIGIKILITHLAE